MFAKTVHICGIYFNIKSLLFHVHMQTAYISRLAKIQIRCEQKIHIHEKCFLLLVFLCIVLDASLICSMASFKGFFCNSDIKKALRVSHCLSLYRSMAVKVLKAIKSDNTCNYALVRELLTGAQQLRLIVSDAELAVLHFLSSN